MTSSISSANPSPSLLCMGNFTTPQAQWHMVCTYHRCTIGHYMAFTLQCMHMHIFKHTRYTSKQTAWVVKGKGDLRTVKAFLKMKQITAKMYNSHTEIQTSLTNSPPHAVLQTWTAVTRKRIPRAMKTTPRETKTKNTCVAVNTGRQAGICCCSHLLPVV